MSISTEVRRLMDGSGPLSRTLYAQLLGFDAVEERAAEFGYKIHFEPRLPMVTFYRKASHPGLGDVVDQFQAIPGRPRWLEESGFAEFTGGLLARQPDALEADVIDVLGKCNEEIRLGVYYCRREIRTNTVEWRGEVASLQELVGLLRDPPR